MFLVKYIIGWVKVTLEGVTLALIGFDQACGSGKLDHFELISFFLVMEHYSKLVFGNYVYIRVKIYAMGNVQCHLVTMETDKLDF